MKRTLPLACRTCFLISLISGFFLIFSASAQSPNLLSYQAIVRDAGGKLVQNHSVGVKISILQGTATGTVVFSETHPVSSNADGLVTVSIGNGNPVTGTLASVNWSAGPYFLKTEVDPSGGISYTITGTSQLLSVPYALYASGSGDGWKTTGNAGINPAMNFVGTSDDIDLIFKRNSFLSGMIGVSNTSFGSNAFNLPATGTNNSAFGSYALNSSTNGSSNIAFGGYSLFSNTSGSNNIAIGGSALYYNKTGGSNCATGDMALYLNDDGSNNSAYGKSSLNHNVSGYSNNALGAYSLYNNSKGSDNTAIGVEALYTNTLGIQNNAVGNSALRLNDLGNNNNAFGNDALKANTTGNDNCAFGQSALASNTIGLNNIAAGTGSLFSNIGGSANCGFGYWTLHANTSGNWNTAIGYSALTANISGGNNTAVGNNSLLKNTGGSLNAAVGSASLYENTTGYYNSATGYSALYQNTTGYSNTAVGYMSLTGNVTGNNNTGIGASTALGTGAMTNTTVIGYGAVAYSSNTFVFGNSAVIGWGFGVDPGLFAIRVGTSSSNGNGAGLTTTGIWTNSSDVSKKYDIRNIEYGLTDLMRLHPVSYKLLGTDNEDIGFIAQEVKKVVPEIVYGEDGQMSMSYGQLTSVLVKAVQEQQEVIGKSEARIKELENRMAQLEELIKRKK